MKAIVAKKAGRIVAVGIPNPALGLSFAISGAKGTETGEVDVGNVSFGEAESSRAAMEKLGARLESSRPVKRATPRKKR